MEIDYSQPNVQGLFKVNYQYRVPDFQRPYAWKQENVDAFWGDITAMDGSQHFMGPMVLHDPGGEVREVVDGQQRLTTLQILLALIRDRYIKLNDPPRDASSSGDPLSKAPESLIRDSGYTNRYFLVTGKHNRPVLEDFILRHPNDTNRKSFESKKDVESIKKVGWAKNKPLVDAYIRLTGHLTEHLKKAADPLSTLRNLEDSVVKRITVVVLDLKNLDDAFLLFETLNDRGLRLSAADLLKSHLLSRIDKAHHSDDEALDAASDTWDAMVDTLGGGDISGFLRHFLLMRHERVKKSDVFPDFKKDVETFGPDKTLKELSTMAEHYAEFLRPPQDDLELFEVLNGLKGTSVDTHRIALLPARAVLEKTRFIQFAKTAELLSFRWTVVGDNAQDLESLYQRTASMIYASEGAQIDEAEELLTDKLPPDKRFREAFVDEALGYAYVAAYALRKIELAVEPGEKTIKANQQVHVEHIMPKTSTEFWKTRITDEEEYEEVVQRWGNLTLLLKKLNESISNGEWADKKHGKSGKDGKPGLPGYSGSSIRLTKDLLALDDWTSRDVELRARWLAQVGVKVWSADADLSDVPSFLEVRADPTLLDDSTGEDTDS